MSTERNLWLLKFENPLSKRFSGEFFRSIPRTPGVYLMYGAGEILLYVGKAKDLRARLRSYRNAHPDQVSRKTLRLVNLIHRIEWRELADEREALLQENALIRQHRPPFNVANKSPESYCFIGFRVVEPLLSVAGPAFRFRITMEQKTDDDTLFGVFKGRGLVRDAYCALLRLLWAAHTRVERFDFPAPIAGMRSAPQEFRVVMPEDLPPEEVSRWKRLIERYFRGTSEKLLPALSEALLTNESIHPFQYHRIQEDLETLRAFYQYGPKRNRSLKKVRLLERLEPESTRELRRPDSLLPKGLRRASDSAADLIAQDEIDDLIVCARFRRSSSDPSDPASGATEE